MDVAVALTSLSHGAGCGCKLPAAELLPIVRGLPAATAPELLVGSWRARLVCDATTSGGLLVAVDPARAGELPGPIAGRLVAGDPGAIAVA
jgi:selenophosphate synthase